MASPAIEPAPPKRRVFLSLPAGIWALGFASLFMDMSSELVHSLLPVFLTTVLGASLLTIGIIEGIAEATAEVTKVFSGAISDYLGRRKPLLLLGYGLAAITKPAFPLAHSVDWVFGARFIDRVGKGVRGAPRDALIADITPAELRGAAYGLRQSLDSVGAFLGPAIAVVLMLSLAGDIRAVFWFATIPAFIAVALIAIAVHEPEQAPQRLDAGAALILSAAGKLHAGYWIVVLLGAIFTLARFSEAFLVLRAQDAGLALAWIPAVMIVMNVSYMLVAYPAGIAADRIAVRLLLIGGMAVLVAADLILANAALPVHVFVGAALWGVHMGLTQGLLSKLIADTAPPELLGTAFGIFNLVCAGSLLLASLIAGALWQVFGAAATFIAGACFASLAAIGLLIYPTVTGHR